MGQLNLADAAALFCSLAISMVFIRKEKQVWYPLTDKELLYKWQTLYSGLNTGFNPKQQHEFFSTPKVLGVRQTQCLLQLDALLQDCCCNCVYMFSEGDKWQTSWCLPFLALSACEETGWEYIS